MSEISNSPAQGNIDPTMVDQARIAQLEQLPAGPQVLRPDAASIYPTEDIGYASRQPDGTELKVIAELAIPNSGIVENNVVKMQHRFMAVVHARNGEQQAYSLVGLQPDEQGNMRAINNRSLVWFSQPGDSAFIGRSDQPGKIEAARLWGDKEYTQDVSAKHLKFELTDQGLKVENSGRNGTWGKIGEVPRRSEIDETTRPRKQLAEAQAEQAAAKQQLEADRDKRVVDARVSVEKAHEMSTNDIHEPTSEDTPVHQADAMQELQDSWQLPTGVTPERALQQIQNTAEQLRHLSSFLAEDGDMTQLLHSLRYDFKHTLDSRYPTYGQAEVQTAIDFLGSLRNSLQELGSDRVLLPIRARHNLNDAYNTVNLIGSFLQNTTPHNGQFDEQGVYDAHNLLERDDLKDIRSQVAMVRALVEEKQSQLTGYRTPEEQNAEKPTAALDKLVHAGMKELAVELQKTELSDQEVADATVRMERYLEDILRNATTSIDAELKFPLRILQNSNKTRSGGENLGQDGRSRRIASEIAVDMLRGTFDIQKSNIEDDIQVMANGEVETGHHRAAALMLLYGKDWIKVARQLGFDIKVDTQRHQKRP